MTKPCTCTTTKTKDNNPLTPHATHTIHLNNYPTHNTNNTPTPNKTKTTRN